MQLKWCHFRGVLWKEKVPFCIPMISYDPPGGTAAPVYGHVTTCAHTRTHTLICCLQRLFLVRRKAGECDTKSACVNAWFQTWIKKNWYSKSTWWAFDVCVLESGWWSAHCPGDSQSLKTLTLGFCKCVWRRSKGTKMPGEERWAELAVGTGIELPSNVLALGKRRSGDHKESWWSTKSLVQRQRK